MKRITLLILIVGAIMVSLALMIFGPYGSLDPAETGFYTSLGAGLLWYIITYFAFKKYMKANSED